MNTAPAAVRAIVCGDRGYRDRQLVHDTLDRLHAEAPIAQLAHGGATGVDTLADLWAKSRRIPVQAFFAHWKSHGNRAGPIRNARMLSVFKPTVVIAFPGGPGTDDMVRRARIHRVRVVRIDAAGHVIPEEYSS